MLARNVWRFREQRRMTASALARHLDWPLVEIDKIENGDKLDMSLDDLERIALALHVDASKKKSSPLIPRLVDGFARCVQLPGRLANSDPIRDIQD